MRQHLFLLSCILSIWGLPCATHAQETTTAKTASMPAPEITFWYKLWEHSPRYNKILHDFAIGIDDKGDAWKVYSSGECEGPYPSLTIFLAEHGLRKKDIYHSTTNNPSALTRVYSPYLEISEPPALDELIVEPPATEVIEPERFTAEELAIRKEDGRRAAGAFAISSGVTLAGVGAFWFGLRSRTGAGPVLGLAMVVVGPSLGVAYAGHPKAALATAAFRAGAGVGLHLLMFESSGQSELLGATTAAGFWLSVASVGVETIAAPISAFYHKKRPQSPRLSLSPSLSSSQLGISAIGHF